MTSRTRRGSLFTTARALAEDPAWDGHSEVGLLTGDLDDFDAHPTPHPMPYRWPAPAAAPGPAAPHPLMTWDSTSGPLHHLHRATAVLTTGDLPPGLAPRLLPVPVAAAYIRDTAHDTDGTPFRRAVIATTCGLVHGCEHRHTPGEGRQFTSGPRWGTAAAPVLEGFIQACEHLRTLALIGAA